MNEQNGKNILERCDYLIINNLNFKQMKKKIFSVVATVAVVAAAGWSYQQSKQYDGMSELALANVEALARNEIDDIRCNESIPETCIIYNGVPVKGERYKK